MFYSLFGDIFIIILIKTIIKMWQKLTLLKVDLGCCTVCLKQWRSGWDWVTPHLRKYDDDNYDDVDDNDNYVDDDGNYDDDDDDDNYDDDDDDGVNDDYKDASDEADRKKFAALPLRTKLPAHNLIKYQYWC